MPEWEHKILAANGSTRPSIFNREGKESTMALGGTMVHSDDDSPVDEVGTPIQDGGSLAGTAPPGGRIRLQSRTSGVALRARLRRTSLIRWQSSVGRWVNGREGHPC
jgi:hypothetical protein